MELALVMLVVVLGVSAIMYAGLRPTGIKPPPPADGGTSGTA